MHGIETMIWKEKERSKIRAVHMDNLRGLLGIRKMDKVPNLNKRELCGVMRRGGKDERIDGVCTYMWRKLIEMLRGCMYGSVQVVTQ